MTPSYLAWRFGTPLLGYRAVVAERGLEQGVAFFRLRARGPAQEAAVVAVLAHAGDRRTAGALVREIARVAKADYLLAIGSGPVGPGGMVRIPHVGPLMTWRAVTATAPPARWDLALGDIELF